jgi:hypothetical protein
MSEPIYNVEEMTKWYRAANQGYFSKSLGPTSGPSGSAGSASGVVQGACADGTSPLADKGKGAPAPPNLNLKKIAMVSGLVLLVLLFVVMIFVFVMSSDKQGKVAGSS